MGFLAALWLPILLAAVLVFVVSSIIHMVLPIHKGDYQKLPDEEGILDALRGRGVGPGAYVFPCPGSMKEMSSPEFTAKYQRGPVGYLRVLPSVPPAIGKNLLQWFLFSLVVGLLAGYAAWHALAPGTPYLEVFRLVGTAAILGYGCNPVVDSIWKGQSWSITLKFVLDGVVYGLVTAGTFAWLWPATA